MLESPILPLTVGHLMDERKQYCIAFEASVRDEDLTVIVLTHEKVRPELDDTDVRESYRLNLIDDFNYVYEFNLLLRAQVSPRKRTSDLLLQGLQNLLLGSKSLSQDCPQRLGDNDSSLTQVFYALAFLQVGDWDRI